MSDNKMAEKKDIKLDSNTEIVESSSITSTPSTSDFSRSSVFRSWLLLCFTTGPVSSMTRTYVPAAIQSLALKVGKTSAGGQCARTGNDCFVEFGIGKVHYTSYVLYLKAIYTALEGVVALLISGIADYSHYRKWVLIVSIVLYGVWALPFAGMTQTSYSQLKSMSALYGLLNVTNGVYQVIEASYIPLFMNAASAENRHELEKGSEAEEVRRDMVIKKGNKVSVLGIIVGNVGGIVALLIGIIISYSRGGPAVDGYHNFLLAITIAGCVTVVSTITASFYIPDVEGRVKPQGEWLIFLTFKRMWHLLKEIRKYPNAFLLCVGWVIWNVTYTNFLSLFVLLFRSTLGIGNTDAEYTVYTWLSYVISSLGSLAWMFVYPYAHMKMETWAYVFLGISLCTNIWGTLGISSSSKVGFKHRWEFWVFDVVYSGSSSALRSLNRVLYSTMLPEGDEAQYFGLEIMLGVAVGWIGDLVNATIQDRTGIDRMPFVPNAILVVVSIVLYWLCDTEKGMSDVSKLVK